MLGFRFYSVNSFLNPENYDSNIQNKGRKNINLTTFTNKKSLQLQYITDEACNKKAVILSLSKFDELFDNMASIAKKIEELQKNARSSSREIKYLLVALSRAKQIHSSTDENSLAPKILLLKQHYEWLNKVLKYLRQYEQLKSEMERKLQRLRIINAVDTKQQEIGRDLGNLRCNISRTIGRG